MQIDELKVDVELVRGLILRQFPEWASFPVSRIEPAGTVNAIFRLDSKLGARLARRGGPSRVPRTAPLAETD